MLSCHLTIGKLSSSLTLSFHLPLLKPLSSPSLQAPNSVSIHNSTCVVDVTLQQVFYRFCICEEICCYVLYDTPLGTTEQSNYITALPNPRSFRSFSGTGPLTTYLQKSDTILLLADRTVFLYRNEWVWNGLTA